MIPVKYFTYVWCLYISYWDTCIYGSGKAIGWVKAVFAIILSAGKHFWIGLEQTCLWSVSTKEYKPCWLELRESIHWNLLHTHFSHFLLLTFSCSTCDFSSRLFVDFQYFLIWSVLVCDWEGKRFEASDILQAFQSFKLYLTEFQFLWD